MRAWFDNLNSWTLDYQLRVKAFFTPSDYTREMFSTVSRGWVTWQVFLVGIFLVNSVLHLVTSDWLLAWLNFLIAALFGLLAMHELMDNMAKKIMQQMMEVMREQDATIHALFDNIEMLAPGATGRPVGGEFD